MVPRRLAHGLDLLNFLLADVRDGLGPYPSIYLLLTHHWDQGSIGFVMAVGGIGAGSIVVAAGYNVAFAFLGALAGAGFVLYLAAMPETAAAKSGGGGAASRSRHGMNDGWVTRKT
ncbi:hypothetical protein AN931_07615 [Mycobacterium intracellulare subsp. chimaera]|nr:hypothetical protein AN480_08755 [Mycobacterium intracellulare subsp. chimaera]ETZ32804.1 putative conserved integral membrane transport protein [Mycobacterium intracellulare MIN_052511_1280]ARV81575.1 hypothetical protein BWK49_09955 [Mycobacterium intracellulare subsp. chimaera]ASL08674.1 putative integral membrane transport protein [Mycobacterium intracellulare subsp. chimaera]ASL20432.1 putative integral membrane transport protein [Mycobacterium intracellulare subsp. chimaera]